MLLFRRLVLGNFLKVFQAELLSSLLDTLKIRCTGKAAPAAAEIPEVTAKGETGAATGAPSTDRAVVRVGVVESVDGNSVAVTTLDLAVSEGTHSIDKAVEVLCR